MDVHWGVLEVVKSSTGPLSRKHLQLEGTVETDLL